MDKDRQKILAISISLLAVIAVFSALNLDKKAVTVLDCSNISKQCVEKEVSVVHTNCSRSFDPSYPNCEKTTKDLEQVSLLTDSANYIRAPVKNDSYTVERVSSNLHKPWDIEFVEPGRALITMKNGSFAEYRKGEIVWTDKVKDALAEHEAGLMGLAIDPEFEENNHIYLFYTYDENGTNPTGERKLLSRISRFKYVDGELKNEEILVDSIPGTIWHVGGRLEFGPGGKLYATTGDGGRVYVAQNKGFLVGKVLRMNKNGTVPESNPFDNLVYSRGHRNPQGLAWKPENNKLFTSEHGPTRFDEINSIEPGSNYGWGSYKCRERYTGNIPTIGDPKPSFHCFDKWTMAPSGITFVRDNTSQWYRDLFITGLRGSHVGRISFPENSYSIFYINRKSVDLGYSRRLRDIEYMNHSLWIIGDKNGLFRLKEKYRQKQKKK